MYKIFTANTKTEKKLQEYILLRADIKEKLEKLKIDPRRTNGISKKINEAVDNIRKREFAKASKEERINMKFICA